MRHQTHPNLKSAFKIITNYRIFLTGRNKKQKIK